MHNQRRSTSNSSTDGVLFALEQHTTLERHKFFCLILCTFYLDYLFFLIYFIQKAKTHTKTLCCLGIRAWLRSKKTYSKSFRCVTTLLILNVPIFERMDVGKTITMSFGIMNVEHSLLLVLLHLIT